jgi:hypothetical protein
MAKGLHSYIWMFLGYAVAGNTKGGSITVPLTSCSTGLDYSVCQIKTKNFNCHTADSKTVKEEVNSTVILPPLIFPGQKDTNLGIAIPIITLNCCLMLKL